MAKKIVRGITDVKTINNQDYDTNNVNDLLSDGQYNYIHRKKGKNEEYHNLTDNIKTISSDNTELLSVTNNNKTTNTATLHPKHDAQKEQVIESTRNTIAINHGTNGTAEKTTVDTNPEKVLEHENLLTDYGISKVTSGNNTTLGLEYTKVEDGFDLNNFSRGLIRGINFVNSPLDNTFFFVKAYSDGNNIIQEAVKLFSATNVKYIRSKAGGAGTSWTAWREQLSDKSTIGDLLSQKQDVLVAGSGITIQGNTISATAATPVEGALLDFFEISSDGFSAMINFVMINSNAGGQKTLSTFVFECQPGIAEHVITGALKEQLERYVSTNRTVSNGAISIKNDGTNMKLINSKSTESGWQQGTFTFYETTGGGGGGGIN